MDLCQGYDHSEVSLSGGWSRQKLELHLGRHSVGCLHLWSRASSLESPYTEELRKVGVRVTEGGSNPLTGGDFSERGLEEFSVDVRKYHREL